MPERDYILEGLDAFCHADDVVAEKRGRGYSLLSRRTGVPVARLRPICDAETVQVLWWDGDGGKPPIRSARPP
jgi:hypothetical protein